MNSVSGLRKSTGRRLCVALGAAALALLPGLAWAGPTTSEGTQTLVLGAHAKNITGYAGPKHTGHILPAGTYYVAEVSGAISYYAKRQYSHPSKPWATVCGTPEAGAGGPLGIDAEFVFARPWTSPCPMSLPRHWNNFEISTTNGVTYSHPIPIGGPFSAPTPEHHYDYALIGSGKYALFRLRDMPDGRPSTADNYGHLVIQVRPAVSTDCAGDGYRSFGFVTEVACLAAI